MRVGRPQRIGVEGMAGRGGMALDRVFGQGKPSRSQRALVEVRPHRRRATGPTLRVATSCSDGRRPRRSGGALSQARRSLSSRERSYRTPVDGRPSATAGTQPMPGQPSGLEVSTSFAPFAARYTDRSSNTSASPPPSGPMSGVRRPACSLDARHQRHDPAEQDEPQNHREHEVNEAGEHPALGELSQAR